MWEWRFSDMQRTRIDNLLHSLGSDVNRELVVAVLTKQKKGEGAPRCLGGSSVVPVVRIVGGHAVELERHQLMRNGVQEGWRDAAAIFKRRRTLTFTMYGVLKRYLLESFAIIMAF